MKYIAPLLVLFLSIFVQESYSLVDNDVLDNDVIDNDLLDNDILDNDVLDNDVIDNDVLDNDTNAIGVGTQIINSACADICWNIVGAEYTKISDSWGMEALVPVEDTAEGCATVCPKITTTYKIEAWNQCPANDNDELGYAMSSLVVQVIPTMAPINTLLLNQDVEDNDNHIIMEEIE